MLCVRSVAGLKHWRTGFFSCKYVKPLWSLVESWISAAVGEPVTLSTESAIFLRCPSFEDSDHLSRLQILGGELVSSMDPT